MKSIIHGLRYDTDKAVLIGWDGYNGNRTDFEWWEAGLYKTPRSGRYFLAGKGGPMTRWAQPVGTNGYTGGSGIVPMTAEEAREWAEQYLDAAEIEAGFAATIADA